MPYTFAICTLGCKVNQYESECIKGLLEAKGFEALPFSAVCDIYIVNSCTVTAESDRKVMQMCRRAIRLNPSAFVCVIGCMAQISPEKLAAIPGIGFVGGNTSKKDVVDEIIRRFPPRGIDAGETTGEERTVDPVIAPVEAPLPSVKVDPFSPGQPYEPLSLESFGHTRAVVKIEDGCDSACAYCVIHTARGPARSRPEADVLKEVEGLAGAGYKEVVLTGIELSSYAYDLPGLLEKVSAVKGIERIRLGSLDPAYITKERISRLRAADKLMPHFHISLQSGSSRILAKMKRKYNAGTALERIKFLKETFPGACLFADVITGFPGETEEDFRETVDFVREVGFLHLHIFPYSKRAGTVAASMTDQVPEDVKRDRAARLDAIQREIKRGILEEIVRSGRKLRVLFEANKTGHSEEFIEIKVAEGSLGSGSANKTCHRSSFKKGEIIDCRPLYTDGDVIYVDAAD
jgi:threonylcarbamoyladenosine tRNA methylthiotransferase MtaB